jgi:hypothetical protein
MGTRTYSRRGANGQRVLTAAGKVKFNQVTGLMEGYDIFGNPLPEAVTPAPVVTPTPAVTTPPETVPEQPAANAVDPFSVFRALNNRGVDIIVDAIKKINNGSTVKPRITSADFDGLSPSEYSSVVGLIRSAAFSQYDAFGEYFLNMVNPNKPIAYGQVNTPEFKDAKKMISNMIAISKLMAAFERHFLVGNLSVKPPQTQFNDLAEERMWTELGGSMRAVIRDANKANDPRVPDYLNPKSDAMLVSGINGKPKTIHNIVSDFIEGFLKAK